MVTRSLSGLEEALVREGRFGRSLLESMADGVVACDADGTLILFNRAAREWHGLDPMQLPPEEWAKHYDLYRYDGVTPLPTEEIPLARAYRGETFTDAGMAIVAKGQPPRFIFANGCPILDAAGKTLGAVAVMRDVTELRRADQELRRSHEELERRVAERTADLQRLNQRLQGELEERRRAEEAAGRERALLRCVFDSASDLIFLKDRDGVYRGCNKASEEFLGLAEAEQIGKTDFDFFDREMAEAIRAIDRRVIETGTPVRNEEWATYADGHRALLDTVKAPYRGPDGELLGLVGIARDITERREAEAAVRASYARFEDLFNKAAVPLCFVNKEGARLTFNTAFEQTFGYSSEELPTLNEWWALAYPDPDYREWVLVTCEAVLQKALAAQTDLEPTEYRVTCKSGDVRAMVVYGSMIGEELLLTFFDITEREQAAQETRAREQLFRALVENSPDFIARYDLEYRRVYVNPAIQKLFGAQAEAALGRTPADQSPVYAPQIYLDHLRQTIETAAENTAEMPFRTAEGEVHWGHMRFVPEFDSNGKVASVLAIGRDIHEVKENERRFRMLAENFPDFVVRFDRDGRYAYVNPAVEKAFGMRAEDIVGKSLWEVPRRRGPAQSEALLALIRRAFDEGAPNEAEVRWDTEVGERTFELRHAPEKDAAGAVVSVLSIARDITERRGAEEEIRRLNQELERRVAERTGQLEAANKELEAFAYSVSHDLRAPLRHIDGFLGLLERHLGRSLDEAGRHHIDTVCRAAWRMGQLIDDLLAFSRMGRAEMARERVELGQLVEEAVNELAPETVDREVRWRISELPTVAGDRAMLKAVFANLLANALKFTRPRETAEIEVGWRPGERGEIVVFVRDNGVGFDPVYADKLFGVFQRLHRVEEFEGTGIGLANVRRIVVRHGGRVWAEGVVDQGATFFFSLPASPGGG